MSAQHLDPLVRPREDGLQLSYQLPHRIYDAKSYPIQAPNGSTIIAYGHDLGLRIIWRGGRAFKPETPKEQPAQQQPKPNGAGNDDVIMILDSDEEEPAPEPAKAPVEFEDEEDEIDPSRPFPSVLRYLDIRLGTKVLALSVPDLIPEGVRSRLEAIPPMLSDIILLTATCADGLVKVITLPLIPPPPTMEDMTAWGVQIVTLIGGSVQAIPAGVSVTLTCRTPSDKSSQYRSQSQRRSTRSTPDPTSAAWDILVAVHSAEASGILSIYRLPITQRPGPPHPTYTLTPEPIIPTQQQYLPSPVKTMCFNPCQYPCERHSDLLLSFANGYVKTYSCLSHKALKAPTDRQNSVAGVDDKDTEGRWLITLFPEFEQDTSQRKSVVDARWVLGGKAIIVLLTDGTWGVWDVENSGLGKREQTGFLQAGNTESKTASGSISSFAVSGRVLASTPSTKTLLSAAEPSTSKSKFAPMTPSTRRFREDTLFKGSHDNISSQSTRGTISVTATSLSREGHIDESILIWHGDQNIRVPSLLSLWRSNLKSTGIFDPSSRYKPLPIANLNLLGEIQNGISQLPSFPSKHDSGKERGDQNEVAKPDILVTAEHQLIILTPGLSAPEVQETGSAMGQQKDILATGVGDQYMLKRGELDLEGMDRVLAGMTNGGGSSVNAFRSPAKAFRSPAKRKLFA
ncbi:hypothetical protein AJ80_06795 [Polytolypa hystricis UAMH7299]|uniref:Nucleoporin NUP37 n=1 Tax=Polytolypa hystricis (strain UAMH7299) TaxID=1447883 RepID=A0A2B7XU34_POLH7|nr:hypothetical protein AJ80_06795 [Polytolypa hystricis UAMH7299]